MYLAHIYSGDLVVHLSISKTKKRELLHLRTAVVNKGPVKCLMWRQTLCLSSQRPLYGHIFQNNGIMVKSTIATKLMAILYRSHSTDGCVVTSIFTWGAACCRGHQQDVIYPFGAGFSNVTFHYLPCLVPSRCSDLFFFFFFPLLKYSIISPLWCAFDAHVAIQPAVDGTQPLQPFVSRFQQADLKMLSPSEVLFDVQPLISTVNRSLPTSVGVNTPWI